MTLSKLFCALWWGEATLLIYKYTKIMTFAIENSIDKNSIISIAIEYKVVFYNKKTVIADYISYRILGIYIVLNSGDEFNDKYYLRFYSKLS